MKSKFSVDGSEFNPETLALGYGYDPTLSEGAVKPPVFLSSTFQFRSAAEGKRFFEVAYGLREPDEGEAQGLIYSRVNNPNIQIFEERMAAWDRTDRGAVFSSGMAAISTTMLSLVQPGEVIIATAPVYGGTHYLLEHVLPSLHIEVIRVKCGDGAAERIEAAAKEIGVDRVRLFYMETPANPTIELTDIAAVSSLAKRLSGDRERSILTAVDNTFMGPVFQLPAPLGADLVIYSATKFIGGHSDLVAGLVTGSEELMAPILNMRTILGTMATPFTGWMLLRSLETLSVRMRRQNKSAEKIAVMLDEHPSVKIVYYPGLLKPGTIQHDIYQRQCSGAGSLIAFEVEGGEAGAFKVLDAFELPRLAVSLGGTESLVEHPMSMTHADVPPEVLESIGVRSGLIRISVGLEHLSDLRRDILNALKALD